MAITVLATDEDVEKRLGRQLTDQEKAKTPGLLEEASALVLAYCRRTKTGFGDPVPDAVVIVTSRMVARVLTTPSGLEGVVSQQKGAGPFQETRNYGTDGVSVSPWLTKADKIMLAGLAGSMVSVPLGSERTPEVDA